MINSEYIRSLHIQPKESESNTLIWYVDVAIPYKNAEGVTQYRHFTGRGQKIGFEAVMKAVTEYVEGL